MPGKVYLIGSGPGDPDLLTKRAIDTLEKSDVVLYDRLVHPKVLEYAGDAKKIDVGKKPGQASKQEDINRLLYSKAQKGKTVARLKNGNPVIFARGGEEREYLEKKGIDVEIVPGLSSATSLPPLLGIPLTKRGVSSSLTILPGYKAGGENPNWEGVGDTTVILMTVENLERVVDNLISAGKGEETLSALIASGATEDEKLLVSPLARIVEMAREMEVEPPSILIVGDVIEDLLNPEGKSITVFRPSHEKKRTEKTIRKAGGHPKVYEICETKPQTSELEEALKKDWSRLVFMSPSSVKCTEGLVKPADYEVIAVGDRTKTELENCGWEKIEVPNQQNSQGIEKLLKEKEGKVLALRSSIAEEDIEGAENLAVYSIEAKNIKKIIEEYLANKSDFTLITSSGILQLLLDGSEGAGKKKRLKEAFNDTFLISIGRKTSKSALENGIWVNYELSEPNIEKFFNRISSPKKFDSSLERKNSIREVKDEIS